MSTGFTYVVMLAGSNAYADEIVATEDVTGAVEDLTVGLRPWLLAYLRTGSRDNGWYTGLLVARDEDGRYDTYDSLAAEDAIWYWDTECAPVPRLTEQAATTRPPAKL